MGIISFSRASRRPLSEQLGAYRSIFDRAIQGENELA
jgi:hypothetical protein